MCAWGYCLAGRSTYGLCLSLLAEATRFLAKMSWYFVNFMMLLTLTRATGPVEAKYPHNIKHALPYSQ